MEVRSAVCACMLRIYRERITVCWYALACTKVEAGQVKALKQPFNAVALLAKPAGR